MIVVEIDANGRKVRVECPDTGVSRTEVLVDVLAAWRATETTGNGAGPAYGFTTQHRVNGVAPMNLRRNVAEPRAEDE